MPETLAEPVESLSPWRILAHPAAAINLLNQDGIDAELRAAIVAYGEAKQAQSFAFRAHLQAKAASDEADRHVYATRRRVIDLARERRKAEK